MLNKTQRSSCTRLPRSLLSVLAVALLLLGQAVPAASLPAILALEEEPPGVLIEIVAGEDAWDDLLPRVQSAVQQIRARFPDIPVAVVSHGGEQFDLTTSQLAANPTLDAGLQQLTGDGVDLHVCGTHASWYGVTPEDYPSIINVSETGPAQANDYRNLGYVELHVDTD